MEKMLLDCTLRDGGYVNDWKFGRDTIVNIFERLVSAGTDVIEVGFLDGRRSFDPDRSIMPDTEAAEKIYGRLNRGRSMAVAMIDYGTCDIGRLAPAKESCLDGIRVIFKKHRMEEALAYCAQVKVSYAGHSCDYFMAGRSNQLIAYYTELCMDTLRI